MQGSVSPCLSDSGMSTLEGVLPAFFFFFFKKGGTSCSESRRSADLPVCQNASSKLSGPGSIRSATLRAFKQLSSSPRQSHSSFTSLSELSVSEDSTYTGNYNFQTAPDLPNHCVTCHLGLSLLL